MVYWLRIKNFFIWSVRELLFKDCPQLQLLFRSIRNIQILSLSLMLSFATIISWRRANIPSRPWWSAFPPNKTIERRQIMFLVQSFPTRRPDNINFVRRFSFNIFSLRSNTHRLFDHSTIEWFASDRFCFFRKSISWFIFDIL